LERRVELPEQPVGSTGGTTGAAGKPLERRGRCVGGCNFPGTMSEQQAFLKSPLAIRPTDSDQREGEKVRVISVFLNTAGQICRSLRAAFASKAIAKSHKVRFAEYQMAAGRCRPSTRNPFRSGKELPCSLDAPSSSTSSTIRIRSRCSDGAIP
jgi:hypothetical protein